MNTVYEGTDELAASERHLGGYNRDIVSKMSSYLPGAQSVLEFGAGIGTLAAEWKRQTGVAPECVEIDAKQQGMIRERGLTCYQSVAEIAKTYDGIYTSNVLEHIEDDVAALKTLHALLKDDGRLVIYVPAFMCLFSDMDRKVGHYRRYHKKELLEKARRAGFSAVDCYYVDSLGFFASLALRLFGYKEGQGLGSGSTLRFYDRRIYPVSRWLDRLGMKYLFGKNLLYVGRK